MVFLSAFDYEWQEQHSVSELVDVQSDIDASEMFVRRRKAGVVK